MISQQHIFGLDDAALIQCHLNHKLLPKVCEDFHRMQLAARNDGIDCQIASSYRSFNQQLVIWGKKWNGEKALLDINEKPLDINSLSDLDKLTAILTWSALPGTSRHHWGSDFDVYDKQSIEISGNPLQLQQCEYLEANAPCYQLNMWLNDNAKQFGFFRPYQNYVGGVAAEPWHLSHKVSASTLQEQFDIYALKQLLLEQEVAGIDIIIDNIHMIHQRFVLNKGFIK